MSHDHHPQPHSPETQIEPQENVAPSYAIPPHTAKQQQAAGLTPVQRWAIRASDSQFNAIAGAVGGFTSGVVTCPLDVIKTKLQAQRGLRIGEKSNRRLYNGLIGTAKVIWKEDGLRGMYRGLGPIILGYLPTWAVWFTVYNKCKVYLGQYHDNPHVVSFWSSVIAGGSSTIATNPIWVIKTRLMSQSSRNTTATNASHHYHDYPKPSNTPTARPSAHSTWHYKSTLDAARQMYSSEGLASFYSGLSPALLGLTHVAVQFPTYEFLKKSFTGQAMGESPAAGQDAHWSGILSASILSKILASTATYPHEVIRTRLQTQRRPVASGQSNGANGAQAAKPVEPKYRGIVHTFRIILHEEGWRAFYAGLGTNMMRAVPAATVTMLTYEYIMRQLTLTRQEAAALLEEQTSTL